MTTENTEEMTLKEGLEKISELTKQAYALIAEAEKIADATGAEFSFDLAYGMGGWYRGQPEGASPDATDKWGDPIYGWQASSQSC